MSKIRRIEEITQRELADLTDPRIQEVRIMGGCACVEVKDPTQHQDVRQDQVRSKAMSGPAKTGGNLVKNKQNAILITR